MYEKEKDLLAQLYSNNADTIKYLPFFFDNRQDFESFIACFGGKTLRIPESYQEFLEEFLKPSIYANNYNSRGIRKINKFKEKILNTYIQLFPSLEEVIKNEYNKKEVK